MSVGELTNSAFLDAASNNEIQNPAYSGCNCTVKSTLLNLAVAGVVLGIFIYVMKTLEAYFPAPLEDESLLDKHIVVILPTDNAIVFSKLLNGEENLPTKVLENNESIEFLELVLEKE